MKPNLQTLALMISAVTFTLLIGTRLELGFAGGQGRMTACPATNLSNPNDTVVRGGDMTSLPDTFAKYQLCDGTLVYLDHSTKVRLNQYKNHNGVASQNTQFELIQGRVIIDGLANVQARNVVVSVTGAGCELVHYSWLDELDVTPLVESGCSILNPPLTPPANWTTKYDTFTAEFISTGVFTSATSAAKNFYSWTELNLN